jgi:hypothetical protein
MPGEKRICAYKCITENLWRSGLTSSVTGALLILRKPALDQLSLISCPAESITKGCRIEGSQAQHQVSYLRKG